MEETRTYEVLLAHGGAFRITIPNTYKITFGPIVGVSGKPAYGTGMALRVWESEKLQRGLWTDVMSFHDVSIPTEVRAVRYFGTKQWFADDGSYNGDKATLVEKQWVDEVEVLRGKAPAEDDDDEVVPMKRRF